MKKIILSSFLLLALVFSPMLANNQAYAQTATSQSQVGCVVLNVPPILKMSSKGVEVTKLQNFLIAWGYLTGTQATGFFGFKTKAALIQFQLNYSLQPDGIVGKITAAFVKNLTCNLANPNPNPTTTGCTSTTTPSVKVVSPNGGEVYTLNNQLKITWASCNLSSDLVAQVSILSGSSVVMNGQTTNGVGEYVFTLNPSFFTNYTLGNNFKTQVRVLSPTTSYFDYSDNKFSVTNQNTTSITNINSQAACNVSTQPYVEVLMPNGSENYSIGQTLNAKWVVCNLPADLPAFVSIMSGSQVVMFYKVTNGTGAHTFTLDATSFANFTLGNYFKVQVDIYNGNNVYSDLSDKTFSVLGPISSIGSGSTSSTWNNTLLTNSCNTSNTVTLVGQPCIRTNSSAMIVCSSTTNPYLVVVSPNGGESYDLNSKINVTWASCNLPDFSSMRIYLLNQKGSSIIEHLLASTSDNDGTESVTLSPQAGLGSFNLGNNFMIGVRYSTNSYSSSLNLTSDVSDNLFSIN